MKAKSKKSANVPNLRFPGFDNPWIRKRIDEIAPLQRGFDLPVNKIEDGRFPVVFSNGILKFHNDFKVKAPGVVTGRSGTIGNVTYIDNDFWPHNTALWVTNFKGNIPKFIYYFYSQYDLSRFGTGSGVPTLNRNNVHGQYEYLPKPEEQVRISAFLSCIDERIQTQRKIIRELNVSKSGIGLKIFSQELRFNYNNGKEFPKWEVKRLGDVCEIIMGQSPNSNSYNIDKIGIPLIQGNADIQNRLSSPRNWTTEVTKECKVGDLILTVRAPVGSVAKSAHNACIGRGVCVIRTTSKETNEFIYQFLLDFETKWSSLEQGSTFTAVSGTEIKNINLLLPSSKEQVKIANFLSLIDEKINTEKALLDKYEAQKKYLLQNLFI